MPASPPAEARRGRRRPGEQTGAEEKGHRFRLSDVCEGTRAHASGAVSVPANNVRSGLEDLARKMILLAMAVC